MLAYIGEIIVVLKSKSSTDDAKMAALDQLKLTLIETSLQSNFTRKKLYNISIHQLINRLSLLAQKTRIFIFYSKKGTQWAHAFNTYKDLLYQAEFQALLKNELHKNDLYSPKADSQWPNKPTPIGKSKFGFLLVAVKRNPVSQAIEFSSAPENERILYERLWDDFLNGPYSDSIGVKERLNDLFQRIETYHAPQESKKLARIPSLSPGVDQEFVDQQIDLVRDILDDIYSGIRDTPLICNKGKIPPNIFFYYRYYGPEDTLYRFEDGIEGKEGNPPYPYSLKILVPDSQRKDLYRAVLNIKASLEERTDIFWKYKYSPMSDYRRLFGETHVSELKLLFKDSKINQKFWNELEREAPETIVNTLEVPFGKNTQSMVDSAFMGGYAHYRPHIFEQGIEERNKNEEIAKGFSGSDDIKRFVYMHYLLLAASPEIDQNHRLGIMSVPIFVNSQTYITLAHATVIGASDEDQEETPEKERQVWINNYFFFNDVVRRTARRLRYRTRSVYKRQIGECLLIAFQEILETSSPKNTFIDWAEVEIKANHYLDLLCRTWPYSKVKIELKDADNDTVDVQENQTKPCFQDNDGFFLMLEFNFKENPYYTHTTYIEYKHFLTLEEVKIELTRAMNEIPNMLDDYQNEK